MLILALLMLADPTQTPAAKPTPMAPPPVAVHVGSCPARADYVRLKPGAIVLPKDAVTSISMTSSTGPATPGPIVKDSSQMALTLVFRNAPVTADLKKGDLIMLQEPKYPNTGGGLRVDDVKQQPDGVHVNGHGENWIGEEHMPRLNQAMAQMMDTKPWPQKFFPAFVLVEGQHYKMPQTKKKVLPKIANLAEGVVLCR